MNTKLNLSNKIYDTLKWIAMVFLPALAIGYLGIADTWNLPYPTEIVATIGAVDAFLGILLGIATKQVTEDGSLIVQKRNESLVTVFGLDLPISQSTLYDVLKWTAQIALPSFATFYMAVSSIWGLPDPAKVISTIMTIDAFLGFLLDFNSTQFKVFNSLVLGRAGSGGGSGRIR